MKRGQVSFEYILLFSFVFLVFITIASFFVWGIEKTDSVEALSAKLAKTIKVKVITASLSEADFEGKIIIPPNINGHELKVELYKDPENLLIIKKLENGDVLSTSFLPVIDKVDISKNNDYTLIVTKKDNKITLTEESE